MLRIALAAAQQHRDEPIDEAGVERLGIVAHHLFWPKAQGFFLRLDAIDEVALAKGYRDLRKQKVQEEGDEEGVVKELQAM